MRKTARRLYGTMIANCNDEGVMKGGLTFIAKLAGFNSSGGMHTNALEWLEEHNKITKIDKNTWKVWV